MKISQIINALSQDQSLFVDGRLVWGLVDSGVSYLRVDDKELTTDAQSEYVFSNDEDVQLDDGARCNVVDMTTNKNHILQVKTLCVANVEILKQTIEYNEACLKAMNDTLISGD